MTFDHDFCKFIPLFFFPLFSGGKRKGEKNNQSRGQKSCLTARSYRWMKVIIKTWFHYYYCSHDVMTILSCFVLSRHIFFVMKPLHYIYNIRLSCKVSLKSFKNRILLTSFAYLFRLEIQFEINSQKYVLQYRYNFKKIYNNEENPGRE